MGCFPARACFGRWKHKHVRHQPLPPREELQETDRALDANTQSSIKEEEIASLLKFVAQSQVQNEEQMNGCSGKTSSGVNMVESENGSVENKKEEEGLAPDPAASKRHENSLIIGNECVHSNGENPLDNNPKGDDGGNGITSNGAMMVENENRIVKNREENEVLILDPAASTGPEDPEDFLIIDEESVQSKEKITLDDDPKGDDDIKDCDCLVLMESSESLFSFSIDSRKYVSAAEMEEKEVSSSPKKPLESSSHDEDDKENVKFDRKCNAIPNSKPAAVVKQIGSKLDGVIAVDTSLSSWLAGSEKTPPHTTCGSSPESEKNYGDRQILGVISPAPELKEFKGSIPSSSGDEQPRFGTVGRYWLQTGVASQ